MAETKRPKWDGSVAISKGKQAISLFETYRADLAPRFPADEFSQFSANIPVLEKKISGKDTVLSVQKSSTSVQNDTVKLINTRVVGIRNIIRSANPSSEIYNAFGLSTKIVLTVLGVAGPADTIVLAYAKHKAWCNSKGIIEKDITELTALTNSLFSADDVQEQNIYARKASTLDANTLQREVEDQITRISALGCHEFELTNPAASKMFADLIPATAPAKKATAPNKQAIKE